MIEVRLTVNDVERTAAVQPRRTLADLLREDLRLTGTHVGCEHGVCGACTILVDGDPARACLMLAVQADGMHIRTIEGFTTPTGSLTVLQEAFRDSHAFQCGFCTPGVLMTIEAFLTENPSPTDTEIREALSGNLCRCTGYDSIVAGVKLAAARLAQV